MDSLRAFQSASSEHLDSKAGIILGFSGTVLTLIAMIPADQQGWWLIPGVLVLAAAMAFAVAALRVRDFRFNPKPGVLTDYMLKPLDLAGQSAKEQILVDKIKAYEENEKVLNKKASRVDYAVILLGAGVVLAAGLHLGRKLMANEKAPKPSPTSQPAPVAVPNPAATNIIKKGNDPKAETRSAKP